MFQVFVLNVLPSLGEVTDSTLCEKDFILSEFTVLAESIQADNELNLLCLEGLRLDFIPLTVS